MLPSDVRVISPDVGLSIISLMEAAFQAPRKKVLHVATALQGTAERLLADFPELDLVVDETLGDSEWYIVVANTGKAGSGAC